MDDKAADAAMIGRPAAGAVSQPSLVSAATGLPAWDGWQT